MLLRPQGSVGLALCHAKCVSVVTMLALAVPLTLAASSLQHTPSRENAPAASLQPGRSLTAGGGEMSGDGEPGVEIHDWGLLDAATTAYTHGQVLRESAIASHDPGYLNRLDIASTLGSALHRNHHQHLGSQGEVEFGGAWVDDREPETGGGRQDEESGAGGELFKGQDDGSASGTGAQQMEDVEMEASSKRIVITTRPHVQTKGDPKTMLRSIPVGSFDHTNIAKCVTRVNYMISKNYEAIPSSYKVLFIIGAQKAGTTWLWQALNTSPAFQGATKDNGEEMKEPHYFTREPVFTVNDTAGYVRMFSRDAAPDMMERLAQGKVALLDGSPAYLPRPIAAARIKHLVPHARLVVVLRDPVARAISALKMYWARKCAQWNLTTGESEGRHHCNLQPLHVTLQTAIDAVRADPSGAKTCFFNTIDDDNQMEPECGCENFPEETKFLRISNYAPMLAWWLAFFPPERLMIVTNEQLKGPGRTKVLNEIVEHVGLPRSALFEEDVEVPDDVANHNPNGASISEEVLALVPQLREIFRQPMAELQGLLDRNFPHLHFNGLQDEL